jgi:hypothetical protein
VRRLGVLLGCTAPDRPDVAAFLQGLQQLGWSDGRNLRIEYRRDHCREWCGAPVRRPKAGLTLIETMMAAARAGIG